MDDVRDPICDFISHGRVGRMTSHHGFPVPDEPHASVTVRGKAECRNDAANWVREVTGMAPIFISDQKQGGLW